MKAVLQRVTSASVAVEQTVVGSIGPGLMILLGVSERDTAAQAEFLAAKCAQLRIFTDPQDKMNLSVLDMEGEALVVSNFTLCADCRKGRRPSFVKAAQPGEARDLYEYFASCLEEQGVRKVATGVFGADMAVEIHNDGPVTIVLDTDQIMPRKGEESR